MESRISIILASFLVISQFTIESQNLGNSFNLSKFSNRFLAELLFEKTEQYRLGYHENPPYDVISSIDKNLQYPIERMVVITMKL